MAMEQAYSHQEEEEEVDEDTAEEGEAEANDDQLDPPDEAEAEDGATDPELQQTLLYGTKAVAVSSNKPLTSKFRGVCWNKKNRRWQAAINSSGKYLYLGSYDTQEEAARIFDKAAVRIRAQKARLNFKYIDYIDAQGDLIPDAVVEHLLEEACNPQKPRRQRSKGKAAELQKQHRPKQVSVSQLASSVVGRDHTSRDVQQRSSPPHSQQQPGLQQRNSNRATVLPPPEPSRMSAEMASEALARLRRSKVTTTGPDVSQQVRLMSGGPLASTMSHPNSSVLHQLVTVSASNSQPSRSEAGDDHHTLNRRLSHNHSPPLLQHIQQHNNLQQVNVVRHAGSLGQQPTIWQVEPHQNVRTLNVGLGGQGGYRTATVSNPPSLQSLYAAQTAVQLASPSLGSLQQQRLLQLLQAHQQPASQPQAQAPSQSAQQHQQRQTLSATRMMTSVPGNSNRAPTPSNNSGPPTLNLSLKPLPSQDPFTKLLRHMPDNVTLDSIIPSEVSEFMGVLFKPPQSDKTGAGVWNGRSFRNLGTYESERDAKQSCISAMELLKELETRDRGSGGSRDAASSPATSQLTTGGMGPGGRNLHGGLVPELLQVAAAQGRAKQHHDNHQAHHHQQHQRQQPTHQHQPITVQLANQTGLGGMGGQGYQLIMPQNVGMSGMENVIAVIPRAPDGTFTLESLGQLGYKVENWGTNPQWQLQVTQPDPAPDASRNSLVTQEVTDESGNEKREKRRNESGIENQSALKKPKPTPFEFTALQQLATMDVQEALQLFFASQPSGQPKASGQND